MCPNCKTALDRVAPTYFGRQPLKDSLPTLHWKSLAVGTDGKAAAVCLVSPLRPGSVWSYPRDGPNYALVRLQQLLNDAADAGILLNMDWLPPTEPPA